MLLLLLLLSVAPAKPVVADPMVTPGALCSERDPDFKMLAYPAHVPICRRHVTPSLRKTAFAMYGIPRSRWASYELDHLIPLALGGSNSVKNLLPQPLSMATKKDKLETKLYRQLLAGRISQSVAVAQILAWHP